MALDSVSISCIFKRSCFIIRNINYIYNYIIILLLLYIVILYYYYIYIVELYIICI